MKNEFCRSIEFHFNRGHLQDASIPMWVLKTKGQTFYIHHLDANAPWSTRENPDHPSTKGSLRFRNAYLTINDDGTAVITSQPQVEATVEQQEVEMA